MITQPNRREEVMMTGALLINEIYPFVCKKNEFNDFEKELNDVKKKYWGLVRELKNKEVRKLVHDNISITSSIRFGKPVIKHTRIAVKDIVDLVEAGYEYTEIIKQFNSSITEEQIGCALVYDFLKFGKIKLFLSLYLRINRL